MNSVVAWLMGLLALIPGVGQPAVATWNGYVEEDYVYAAAPTAGPIDTIAVKEGDDVKKGAVLFTLDAAQQRASYAAARAQADAAQSNLANLQSGQRPEEIEVTKAQLAKAQSNLALAKQTLSRTLDLFRQGNAPQSNVDSASSAVQSAQSEVDTLQAQIAVANLPARPDQQAVHAPVGELARKIATANLPGPVLVMLGATIGRTASRTSRDAHAARQQRG